MKVRKTPNRMCVGCQTSKTKKELLRVVRTPAGEIRLDPTGKLAGRGAYICQDAACFTKAYKEKRLERALKQAVDPAVYEDLVARIKPNE
ncbi:MAG: YlxR family protein [Sporomusaceae bacterium]|nr:YlxR family protein [Sporomusaceae bacterium]